MTSQPVTLLLTSSVDAVADLIVGQLGSQRVFRYNSDLWADYRLRVTAGSLEIENSAGRRITTADVAKVYRRWTPRIRELDPSRQLSLEQLYMEEEVWSAINDLVHQFWSAEKLVLVQPFVSLRLGKLRQMELASKHFAITPFSFLLNRPDALRARCESVVKSFNLNYAADTGFYARRVREDQLDPSCPWFITDYIAADADVTVVFVRDQLFAFSLDRQPFIDQTIDWRLAPPEHARHHWTRVELPAPVRDGIFDFMRAAAAHYARLDFLRTADGYVFLESNFTGEWHWLDPHRQHGLADKILSEIDPTTPVFACPYFG